jgi:S-layer homology domain
MTPRSIRKQLFGSVASALVALVVPGPLPAEEERHELASRVPVTPIGAAGVSTQGVDPDLLYKAKAAKSGFGVDDMHVVNVPFSEFFPRFSSASYTTLCCVTEGGRWPTASDNILVGTIDAGLVPNGARVELLAFYIQDDNGVLDANFRGFICRSWVDADGANPDQSCTAAASSFGNAGDTVVTVDLNLPVRYRYDIDNDGTDEVVSYTVWAEFGTDGQEILDGSIRLRQAQVLYRRQISPAPAQASFNDVAPGDFGFQHIEALFASGITGGCGGGNFCPDDPLTRAQMAVFLAKALGLHWPGPAAP